MLCDYTQAEIFREISIVKAYQIGKVDFTYTKDALGRPTDTILGVHLCSKRDEGQPLRILFTYQSAEFYHKHKPKAGDYYLIKQDGDGFCLSAEEFAKRFQPVDGTSSKDIFDVHRYKLLALLEKTAEFGTYKASLLTELPELAEHLTVVRNTMMQLNLMLANAN